MNSASGDGPPTSGGEIDEPIRPLSEQEQETSPDFFVMVRNRIERRTATAHLVHFSWHLPQTIFLEMLGLFKYVLTSLDGRRTRKP